MTGDLVALAERVEACIKPTRELADEVLLACGWRLNHDADDIAAWRVDAGTVEGEDGEDYPVTLADRMNWACWYKPGNKPFRDAWIDGHYRADPLASLDAAMSLVPGGWHWMIVSDDHATVFKRGRTGLIRCPETSLAATPALALTAACLRAIAHAGEAIGDGSSEIASRAQHGGEA